MTLDPDAPRLRIVSGRFFRTDPAERVGAVLAPPNPEHAGRHHRTGQATLDMSPPPE